MKYFSGLLAQEQGYSDAAEKAAQTLSGLLATHHGTRISFAKAFSPTA